MIYSLSVSAMTDFYRLKYSELWSEASNLIVCQQLLRQHPSSGIH